MNSLNDEEVLTTDYYPFCQLTHLALPFYDFDVSEDYDVFLESHFDSSFASSNVRDDQYHIHISSSAFDSPHHHKAQDRSSCFREFNGEHFRPGEELMENENKRPSKTRIRWTEELHQKFINCIDQLGGAQKATPKKLLHLMKTKGLTLFHIKSHLQKYRISRRIQESLKGKSERKTEMKALLEPNQNIGKQLMEAVRQQLDIQSSLNEQLEVQKNLISAIEEQMRQLRRTLDQRKRNPAVFRNDGEIK